MTFASFFPVQPILAEFKFVGFDFFLSLLFLWILAQGLVWLSTHYSRLISKTYWWKSAMMTFCATFLMVIGWSIPGRITGSENLIYSMTSAIILGAIATWIISGYLYNLEIIHRMIVAVGVPLLFFCASAMGLVVFSKLV